MKIHRWGAQDVSPSTCSQNKASNNAFKWMGLRVSSGAYLCCVQLPGSLILNILHGWDLIQIKHLQDTPRLQQAVTKKTTTRVSASCHVQQRHCSLCEGWDRVRLASPSPSQWHNTTVTFVWAFYNKGHFCQSETLLACHYYDSLGFTIFPQFTEHNGDAGDISWMIKRKRCEMPAKWTTPKILTRRTVFSPTRHRETC